MVVYFNINGHFIFTRIISTFEHYFFSKEMPNKKAIIPSCADCKLCSFTVLKSISTEDLEEVSNTKIDLFVAKGQRIFSAGNNPGGLYALYQGKVKIHNEQENGSEQLIQLLAPGAVFGYKALLCEEPYSNSATAIEDSLVCLISGEVFNNILSKSHKVKKQLIYTLSDDLESAHSRMELSNKPAKDRVIHGLYCILKTYGVHEETGELNAQLTRKDLASLAGLTLETTIRTLNALKAEGILDFKGKRISVFNKDKFVKIATSIK